MSDPVWPHRRQPTRLPRPWDFPSKNTSSNFFVQDLDYFSIHIYVLVMSNSCDPMSCSRLGFSVHGILQTGILEWLAISSSRGSFQPWDRTCVSLRLLHWRVTLYHCGAWGFPKKTKISTFRWKDLRAAFGFIWKEFNTLAMNNKLSMLLNVIFIP